MTKLKSVMAVGSLGFVGLLGIVMLLLIKPALILLGLQWVGVTVAWKSVWTWLGAILLSFLMEGWQTNVKNSPETRPTL